MAQERTGAATFKGNALTLLGPELKVGDQAPDFKLQKNLLEAATLQDFAGKVKLISVVPSLDTGVCDAQTRRFNQEADSLGDQVVVLTVSVDLPFAQARWCGAAGIDRVLTLSDYKDHSFGEAYGVFIKEFHLDHRAIFVIDQNDKIAYVEYLSEMSEHPDYDQAIAAVKNSSKSRLHIKKASEGLPSSLFLTFVCHITAHTSTITAQPYEQTASCQSQRTVAK